MRLPNRIRSAGYGGPAAAVLAACLVTAPDLPHSATAQNADLSALAGRWVYEFTCVDLDDQPYATPIMVKIEPNGEIFEFEANAVIGDMERGNWAGFEFQVTFRDNQYPVQLGDRQFGYDNVRFNLEPGGDLFVGRHVFAEDFGSLRWCGCDGVRLRRMPAGQEPPTTFSPDAEMRPIKCRDLPIPDDDPIPPAQ